MLASFLKGRTMTVKVNAEWSLPSEVNAGAPQGSVLGTYVFNIGTDALEENFQHNETTQTYELNNGDLTFLELAPSTSNQTSTPERQAPGLGGPTSPLDVTQTSQSFSFLPIACNIPPSMTNRIEPTFVDDNLQNEKLYMKDIPITQIEQNLYKHARAGQSEKMFAHISRNVEDQGLLVNRKKTNVLTISGATSYQARTHIYDNQTRIDCKDKLKALGFVFNRSGDVSDQIEQLCRRFRSRTWALRDLRKSGLTSEQLLTVYKSTIRPVVEYSSVIYHSMATAEQAHLLEKQDTSIEEHLWKPPQSKKTVRVSKCADTSAEKRRCVL